MWKKKEVFTIPNLISMFRLVLAGIFLKICFGSDLDENREILIGILAVSAVSDFLDGKIARKFHMVSELGKIIDPVADKVTQGVLLICFLYQYKMAKYVLVIFLVKEIYTGTMGLKTITKTGENAGAMWYGKVSTAFFYVVMIVLLVFAGIPQAVAEGLIVLCGFFMIMALVLYARRYRMLRNRKEE